MTRWKPTYRFLHLGMRHITYCERWSKDRHIVATGLDCKLVQIFPVFTFCIRRVKIQSAKEELKLTCERHSFTHFPNSKPAHPTDFSHWLMTKYQSAQLTVQMQVRSAERVFDPGCESRWQFASSVRRPGQQNTMKAAPSQVSARYTMSYKE